MSNENEKWEHILPNLTKWKKKAAELRQRHIRSRTMYRIINTAIKTPLVLSALSCSFMSSFYQRPVTGAFLPADWALMTLNVMSVLLWSLNIWIRPSRHIHYLNEKIGSYDALSKSIDMTISLPLAKRPLPELFCSQVTNAFDYIK